MFRFNIESIANTRWAWLRNLVFPKNWTFACVKAIAIVIMLFSTVDSLAAPELRYSFQPKNTLAYKLVGSRAEVCELFAKEWPTGTFTNPRVAPGWDTPNRYSTDDYTFIYCLYEYDGDPDNRRAPGIAHCTPTYPGSNSFVVDMATETCTCAPGKRIFPDKPETCIAVTERTGMNAPPNDPSNNGPSCDRDPRKRQPSCGEPINPGTGNMWHVERDYVSPSDVNPLSIVRVHNSTSFSWAATMAQPFGTRWTQPYDSVLRHEQAFVPGAPMGRCWRREDTLFVWCEAPVAPTPSAIPDAVSITRGDGKRTFFNRSGTNWVSKADTNDRVTAVYNDDGTAVVEWVYSVAQGGVTDRFGVDGLLISTSDSGGAAKRFTYGDGTTNESSVARHPENAPVCGRVQGGAILPKGRLMCVTDHAGRQIHFEYDSNARIVKVTAPGNEEYLYEYDGPSGGCAVPDGANRACNAGNLTKVTYPDGKDRIYFYNEPAQINGGVACPGTASEAGGFAHLLNAWTGLQDENGARHISWTYDCQGRATSSQLAGGVNKVLIGYSTTSRAITHYSGTPELPIAKTVSYYYYDSTRILGVSKNTGISSPCAECGDVKDRTYDVNGNIASLQDWNSKYSCYAYDLSRNLETVRLEGVGGLGCASQMGATSLAAPARKTSTRWHPSLRLEEAVAAPLKLTTYSYDASGNLLSATEQATSDATGVLGFTAPTVGQPRMRTFSRNERGQILTSKGPRTDIDDTTTYSYDSFGNLQRITNAVGHPTQFSNYDAHGRVGRISSPNGLVTDLGYTLRGQVSWRTVSTGDDVETTRFDYDGAGQLTRVTHPDGSVISYYYDDAHRLTSIVDTRGNSVNYTLDLRGNRIQERVNDSTGTLVRHISRTYDAMNRLQSSTGVPQ